MPLRLEDFRKPERFEFGLDVGKVEYESVLESALAKHIDTSTPLHEPMKYSFSHPALVGDGWLVEHGAKSYTLSRRRVRNQ